MSKVNKLQQGGTLKDKRKERLKQKLEELSLSEEDKIEIGRQADKWLAMPETAQFNVSVSGDYSISGGNTADNFSGSKEGVKSNWLTGKLKVKTPEDANSVLANIWSSLLEEEAEESTKAAEAEKNKPIVNLKKYHDYLADYYDEDPSERIIGDNNEARQAIIMRDLKGLFENYKKEAQNNPDYNYKDLDNVNAVLSALNTSGATWETFSNAVTPFNWDMGRYLLNDEQLKEIEEAKTISDKEKKEKEQLDLKKAELESLKQEFTNYGITDPNIIESLINLKVKPFIPNPEKEKEVALSNLLKERKWWGFKYGEEEYLINDENFQPVEITGESIDEESPYAGNQWKNMPGKRGAVHSTYKYEVAPYATMFPNLHDDQIINDPGEIKKVIESLQSGLTERTHESDVAASKVRNYLISDHDQIPVKTRRLIENLLMDYWSRAGGPNANFDKETNFSKWLKDLWKDFSYKNGGKIKKAQNGMTFSDYAKAVRENKPESKEVVSKMKDIRNTWKGMGSGEAGLRGLSIAGAATSFAPGPVGSIGAAVTMGADIAADVAKDGFQVSDVVNWNTALNAGFIALSFVGLGGLRGAKLLSKLGKTAKTADAVTDIKRVGKLLDDTKAIKKLGFSPKEVNNAKKLLAVAEKNGAKSLVEIGESAVKNIAPAKKDAAALALSTVKKTAESGLSPAFMGSSRLGKLAEKTQKTAKSTGEAAVSGGKSLGNLAIKGAMLSPLVFDLPKTIYTGITEGWEYTDPNSVKNSIYGLRAGKGLIDDVVLNRHNAFLAKKAEFDKINATKTAELPKVKEAGPKLSTSTSLILRPEGQKAQWELSEAVNSRQRVLEGRKKLNQINNKINNLDKVKAVADKKRAERDAIALAKKIKSDARIAKSNAKKAEQKKRSEVAEKMVKEIAEKNKAKNKPKTKPELPTETTLVPTRQLKTIDPNKAQERAEVIRRIKAENRKSVSEHKINNVEDMKVALRKKRQIKDSEKPILLKGGNIPKYQNPSGNITISQRKGLLNSAKDLGIKALQGINNSDLSNAIMFANTLSTNRKLERDRIKSIAAEGSFRESGAATPVMLNIADPGIFNLAKEAGNFRSQARRIGKSVDINNSIAAQLEAEEKIQNVVSQADQNRKARMDSEKNAYIQSLNQVNTYNLGVANRNRERAAKTEAAIIKSPMPLLNNNALTTFLHANNQNANVKEYNKKVNNYLDKINDPELKAKVEQATFKYEKHYNTFTEVEKAFKENNTSGDLTFEKSKQYLDWEKTRKALQEEIDKLIEPVKAAKLDISRPTSVSPFFNKKGGNLEKARFDLASRKQAESNALKEKELAYKAIFKNQELLFKALAIMFK